MEKNISKNKTIDIYIRKNVLPNCMDVFEENDNEFIWYYTPARLIDVNLQLRTSKGECLFSVLINDISISLEDPFIKTFKNDMELLSEIDNTKNLISFGDRIKIRSYECKPNLDLLVKFLFIFE